MTILFYETPNGNVAVLSRLAERCSECPYSDSENPIYTGDVRNSTWFDNSPALQESYGSSADSSANLYCNTPFASSQYTNGANFSVVTYFPGNLEEQSPGTDIGHTIYTPLEDSENLHAQTSCK